METSLTEHEIQQVEEVTKNVLSRLGVLVIIPMVMGIITTGIWVGTMQSEIEDLKETNAENETKIEILVEIQAELKYIKASIDDNRSEVGRLQMSFENFKDRHYNSMKYQPSKPSQDNGLTSND
jgi:hypothetical protein